MSKFTNINASGIKNSVETALIELQRYGLTGEISALSNKETLNSQAAKVITALNDIRDSNLNGSISNLKKHLNNLSYAADYIVKYQQAELSVESLKRDLYYYDSNGIKQVNSSIQSRINQLNYDMETYEQKIEYYLS